MWGSVGSVLDLRLTKKQLAAADFNVRSIHSVCSRI